MHSLAPRINGLLLKGTAAGGLLKAACPEVADGRKTRRLARYVTRAGRIPTIRLPLFYAGTYALGQTHQTPGRISLQGIRCICSSTC